MISYFRSTSNGDFLMVGLSTDTKPITNIPNGARFLEMDTSKQYYFDESTLTYIEQASSSGNVFHGTIHVTENGEYSVYGYAAADVNVSEASGSIEIYENGEYDVTQYATAEVYTPEPYGEISITENGEYDVTEYEAANVQISPNYLKYFTREISAYSNSTISAIGYGAFEYCRSLTSVSAPSAESIGSYAFSSCYLLENVYAPSVTYIGSYAFYNCSNLKSVDFPVADSILQGTFQGCSRLETANLPSCKSLYGGSAFANCQTLVSVSLPACSFVGTGTFVSCASLQAISLPSAKEIWGLAFSKCFNLTSLYLMGATVCKLSSSVFTSTPIGGYSASAGQYGSVYVPASLLASYQSSMYWSSISSRIVGV